MVGCRDGLVQGRGLHFTLTMTQVVEGHRTETAFSEAAHQRKELLGAAAPAVYEYDHRSLAGLVGLDPAILGFDIGLLESPRQTQGFGVPGFGNEQFRIDAIVGPARQEPGQQVRAFFGECRKQVIKIEVA